MLIDDIVRFLIPYYTQPSLEVVRFYTSYSRPVLDVIHSILKSTFNVLLIAAVSVSVFYLLIMLFTLTTRKKPILKSAGENKLPFVTIQIPTYNEIVALNCARRCLEFDYPKDRYEIIIGDDSNRKEISGRIDSFASKHPGLIRITRRGTNAGFKPANLNHMLKSTKGEIIVIFDSDFLPPKDFLKKIVSPFAYDTELAVVQARWKISNFTQNPTTLLGGSVSLVMHHFAMPFITRKLGTSFLCGSAEAIRKKALIAVGGWKEGSLTEDIECSLRLMKAHYKLTYLEELECDCETPFTVKDFCKQQMRWAYGVISAFKEHFSSFFLRGGVTGRNKLAGSIMLTGYTFSFLLMCLFVFGTLSFFTDRPAPINWSLFLSETGRNILLTCGFLFMTLIAVVRKNYARYIAELIFATFSIGLIVTGYVNLGIMRAVFGRPMHWFMIAKRGEVAGR
jgi:cellulose synthase/poly-beta-1,6-N-acetylglucosamine synthase-like glycosyltransferase